jgi:hypothetical protein
LEREEEEQTVRYEVAANVQRVHVALGPYMRPLVGRSHDEGDERLTTEHDPIFYISGRDSCDCGCYYFVYFLIQHRSFNALTLILEIDWRLGDYFLIQHCSFNALTSILEIDRHL